MAVVILSLLGTYLWLGAHLSTLHERDFAMFYHAAIAPFGHNYDPIVQLKPDYNAVYHVGINLNPPLFTACLRLVIQCFSLSLSAAYLLWISFNLLLSWLACWILARQHLGRSDIGHYAFAGMLVAWPTVLCLSLGQLGLLVASLLAFAWLTRKRCPELSIALLALLASIKLFALLFVFYFAWQKRWRDLVIFCVIFLVLSLLPLALGFTGADYAQYVRQIVRLDWTARMSASIANVSLLAPVARWHYVYSTVQATAGNGVAALMPALVVFMLYCGLSRKIMRGGHKNSELSLFVLTVLFMLILSPLSWVYYWPVLAVEALLCFEQLCVARLYVVVAGVVAAWLTTFSVRLALPAPEASVWQWFFLNRFQVAWCLLVVVILCLIFAQKNAGLVKKWPAFWLIALLPNLRLWLSLLLAVFVSH